MAIKDEYEFQFTAGMGIRKYVRDMLEGEVFSGAEIRWMEQKRLMSSLFRVRGRDAKLTENRVVSYIRMGRESSSR